MSFKQQSTDQAIHNPEQHHLKQDINSQQIRIPNLTNIEFQQNQANVQKCIKKCRGKIWTPIEDETLLKAASDISHQNWEQISMKLNQRNAQQCKQRWLKLQPQKKKLSWTKRDDIKLIEAVEKLGDNWNLISKYFPQRSLKQIHDRFHNKLNPNINRRKFSESEDLKILSLYREFGPQWKIISSHFMNRPENMLKNRFYSYINKVYNIKDISIVNSDVYNKKNSQISDQGQYSQYDQASFSISESLNTNDNSIQLFQPRNFNLNQQSELCQEYSIVPTPQQISPTEFFNLNISVDKKIQSNQNFFNFEEYNIQMHKDIQQKEQLINLE